MVLSVATATSGCGALLQSAIGWDDRAEREVDGRTHLQLTATATGAEVFERRSGAPDVLLGPPPVLVEEPFRGREITTTTRYAGLIIGGVLEAAAAIAMFAWSEAGDDYDLRSLQTIGASYVGAFAFGDLLTGIIIGTSDPTVKVEALQPMSRSYLLRQGALEGPAVEVKLPERTSLTLALRAEPTRSATAAWAEQRAQQARTLAVLEVEEPGGPPEAATSRELRAHLGARLGAIFRERGRLVSAPDRVARVTGLRALERGDDDAPICPGPRCAGAVGLSLSVRFVARPTLTRSSGACVLRVELIDVFDDSTAATAASRGPCDAPGLERMATTVATQLSTLK